MNWLTEAQVAWLNTPSPIDGKSPADRGSTLYNGYLMKFKYTRTPLKDVPLSTVVDGYKLIERSHTGKNAVGWRMHEGRYESVLLIYTEAEFIAEKV